MKRAFAVLSIVLASLLAWLALPQEGVWAGKHTPSGRPHTHTKPPGSTAVPKVHVRGYTRKDGTYVAPHDRAAPGYGNRPKSGAGGHVLTQPVPRSQSRSYTVPFSGMLTAPAKPKVSGPPRSSLPGVSSGTKRDLHGKIKRSEAAKDQFKRQHPCPTTGKTSGPCPGYVIDHIVPLCASGPDAAYNMQWQTTEQAKEKDKWEKRECRPYPGR